MSKAMVLEPYDLPVQWHLRDYLEILRRRRMIFLLVLSTTLGLAVLRLRSARPVYQTVARLLVPTSSNVSSMAESSSPIAPLLQAAEPDSIPTQLQVLQSDEFIESAKRAAGIVDRLDVAPPAVQTDAAEGSNIIGINVEGGDPQAITRLANAIIDLHTERMERAANRGLQNALSFVRQQQDKAEVELARAEQRLLQFHRTHGGSDLTTEREARTSEYTALLGRELEIENDITTTRAQVASLRERLPKEPLELVQSVPKENPRYVKLRDRLDDLTIERMGLLREYRPTSRQVQDIDRYNGEVQQQLAAAPKEIQVFTHAPNPERARLQSRLQEAEATLRGYEDNYSRAVSQSSVKKQSLRTLGPWEIGLNRLTGDRDAARSTVNELADRIRGLETRAAAGMPTVRVIARPELPNRPVGKQRLENLFLSGMLALILAVGAVFFQEYLDDRLASAEEIKRLWRLKVLAYVPAIRGRRSARPAGYLSYSHLTDAYSALRANIGLASLGAPIRRLQITSSTKGEGKSTTSVHLAESMARSGKHVILVDADMRSPTLHRLLNTARSPGLADLLSGTKSVEESLQPSETENLMVIPAGEALQNPSELLDAGALEGILQDLQGRSDIVIIDTPPCLPVSDPLQVAAHVNAVILVVQAGQTARAAVQHALELLQYTHARLVGVVLNQVHPYMKDYYYCMPYQYTGAQPVTTERASSWRSSGPEQLQALSSESTGGAERLDERDQPIG